MGPETPARTIDDDGTWKARYELLREVGELILSDVDDDRLLQELSDRVIRASAADGAVLARIKNGGGLDVVTARSYLKSDIAKPEFEVSRTIIQRAAREGKPVFVENALELPEKSRTRSMRELKVLSVIALPLTKAAGDAPFAVLYLDRRRPGRLFSAADLEMLADVLGWANQTLSLVFAARKSRPAASAEERGGLVGNSAAMGEVLAFVARAAPTDANILIRGETGTGKELVAQLIHQRSGYRNGPFVAINCAAIPTELLESELFGHEAGAFTGAQGRRIGRLQEAAGGTIFLDEIGDMPPPLQAKILRAVETRRFRVLGGKELPLEARLLAATHQPLEKLIKSGKFREDLYFRLAVLEVELPPLRDRRDDVLDLADHFIRTLSRLRGRVPAKLSRSAQSYLVRRAYPGNVRELGHLIERALLFCDDAVIDRNDLRGAEPRLAREEEEPLTDEAFRKSRDQMIRDLEHRFIARLLRAHGGNVAAAARASGFSEVYLYRLIKRHLPKATAPGSDPDEDDLDSDA